MMKFTTGSRGIVANTWSDAARESAAEHRKSGSQWTGQRVSEMSKQPYGTGGPNGLHIKVKPSTGKKVKATVTTKTGVHEMTGSPDEAAAHINKHVDAHMA